MLGTVNHLKKTFQKPIYCLFLKLLKALKCITKCKK